MNEKKIPKLDYVVLVVAFQFYWLLTDDLCGCAASCKLLLCVCVFVYVIHSLSMSQPNIRSNQLQSKCVDIIAVKCFQRAQPYKIYTPDTAHIKMSVITIIFPLVFALSGFILNGIKSKWLIKMEFSKATTSDNKRQRRSHFNRS